MISRLNGFGMINVILHEWRSKGVLWELVISQESTDAVESFVDSIMKRKTRHGNERLSNIRWNRRVLDDFLLPAWFILTNFWRTTPFKETLTIQHISEERWKLKLLWSSLQLSFFLLQVRWKIKGGYYDFSNNFRRIGRSRICNVDPYHHFVRGEETH